ncbi:MAG: helix-turn-helix domain-containing protein [Hamadaea sp.]|uniref:helix-turn-helix domain-containing protein n=1 Tax=Hamadaea sp. TaxID=2024425 RepID=UPI0017B272BC|nr:XRE family transcriptional regulator [Hamadaea sp.]NUT17992.1 helix-turn-helix domain-containing protein [Hamadaea sp.]
MVSRGEQPLDPSTGILARFASRLRELRESAGRPSYSTLAARTHYSRSALAQATDGRKLPSWPVVQAYVQACGADVEQWRQLWCDVRDGVELTASLDAFPDSPWPAEPVVDGADPDAAGCSPDAITVTARRLSLDDRRVILGSVQLRYSALHGAAWARFEGFGTIDRLAGLHAVEVALEIRRAPDGVVHSCRSEYAFDYHWSDLLRTGRGEIWAVAVVYADGVLVGSTETARVRLP